MTKNQSQARDILHWLEERGSITPEEARAEFGCMRLGARIWDLRHEGYAIVTESVRFKSRSGRIGHYARYRLEVQP